MGARISLLTGIAGLLVSFALAACSGGSDSPSGAGGASSGAGGGTGGADAAPPPENPEDYLDRSLRDQVSALEDGKITSAGLTKAYLARLATLDQGASGVHAVIVTDPQAEQHAAELDGKRGKGALLQGAVILVKDNIDTQGIATTAGSLAMANNVPMADAPLVKRMHDAQGLMFGKTNLSEWANFRGYKSTSGWSSLGGQTFNGRNTAYDPCGSSSGSAAAVAAGLASAALGTETNGSITCPASVNGVVGFKPTVGLVSRTGVIPISQTQDTVGPITRTVGDAARLLSVIAGADPNDPATQAIPQGMSLDFEAPLANATLQGKRLGVVTNFGFNASVMAVFNTERARLMNAGAQLVDVTLDLGSWGNDETTMLTYEFKAGINAYLAAHPVPGQAATLQDLINFNQQNAATVMPYFGQERFIAAQATTDLNAPVYLSAKQKAQAATGKNGIAAALSANNLDALISPTTGPAWKINYLGGDPPISASCGPAAVAGYPHLTVPMGNVNGLPIGMSLFAAAWDDAKVLALGYAYEQLPK